MAVIRSSRWRDGERGAVTVFVVVLALVCLVFAGLVLDGGLALATKIRVIGDAENAARAAAQQLDLATYRRSGILRLQPEQARAAAYQDLAVLGEHGSVTITGNTVTVTITATDRTQLLGLVGIHEITVTGGGSAAPAPTP